MLATAVALVDDTHKSNDLIDDDIDADNVLDDGSATLDYASDDGGTGATTALLRPWTLQTTPTLTCISGRNR